MSFTVPVICSTFAVWSKFALKTKKIKPSDFTFGYFILAKGVFLIVSLIHFQSSPVDWKLWLIGLIGSVMDCIGCFFANCAIATGNQVGPILALMDSQMLLITVIVCIKSG